MDDRTLKLAAEELAKTQSPLTENWFTDGQLRADDREQLHQLLAALLRMYDALPNAMRAALTMISTAPDCTRENLTWCIDFINQAISQTSRAKD